MSIRSVYSEKPWLRHYPESVSRRVFFSEISLPEHLSIAARTSPHRPALLFEGFRMSYAELDRLVNRMAASLVSMGINKGDRVALLLPNLVSLVATHFAVLKIGGVVVMNNPLYTDRELIHQFNDSGAKLLVTLDLLADRMVRILPKTGVERIIHTSIGEYLPPLKRLFFPLVARRKKLGASVSPHPRVMSWKEMLKKGGGGVPNVAISMQDTAVLQYTGGTTGPSKGAVLTHGNLSRQVDQLKAWFPEGRYGEERFLGALPFFHIFGLSVVMHFSVAMGSAIILLPKPDSDALLSAIGKFRPTFACMVPTMYIGLLKHPEIDSVDMSSIEACFSGSAPLPLEVIQEFESRTGAVIVEGFGMTETSPVTHAQPLSGLRKEGSVGIPLPNTEIRLVDPADGKTDVPMGEVGEIFVKGPQVMTGYHENPLETEHVFVDGWLRTGDMARMDEDGYFFIVDRIKDVIKINAISVFPREIDEVLFEHPKILEACTIGVPHPERGEVPKAYVVVKEKETLSKEEVVAWCTKRLARFKVPRDIAFTSALPKSAVGKILRRKLRALDAGRRGDGG